MMTYMMPFSFNNVEVCDVKGLLRKKRWKLPRRLQKRMPKKKKKRYPHTMNLAGIHFCGMRGCYKYPSHKISLIMNDIDR